MALPVSWVGKTHSGDDRVETIQIWPVYRARHHRFTEGFDRHAERLGGFLRTPG
jgi:hypothetical protein